METNPDYSFAYSDRSRAKASLNDANGAIEDLSRAIDLDPNFYWNYIDRGKLFIFANDPDSAFLDFDKAIRINPDFFYAYVYRGGINQENKDIEAAVYDYNKVIELRPDYYFVYESLAQIEYLRGNYTRAGEMFLNTSKNIPEDPAYILMAGISFYAAGDKNRGLDIIRASMDKMPRESYFYDIARMFSEPGYDAYLVSKISRETKRPLKARVLFYIATFYKIQGNNRLAKTYFLEVADAKIYGMFETALAENEIKDEITE